MPKADPITDARTVAEHARDVLDERHPGWTDEQLLYHPDKAKSLCKEVRGRMGRPYGSLPDHDVLRALVNARKRGRVRGGRKREK